MAIGSNTDPNFNVQSPTTNQTLVYDDTQQAFVNATVTNSGSAITGGANVGSGGSGVFKQASGTDLQFRSLVAGNNVTITENTDNVTISAVSSVTSGLNLGDGEGLFVDITTGNIRLKSISAGAGITLTASGTEVSVSVDSASVDAGTLGGLSSSDFLQKSDNLAAVADVSTARTNLGVYSKTEADAKYQPKAGDILPDQDNTRSIGDNSNRFSDVYAVELHGTATRAGTVMSITDHNINDLSDVDTTGKANGHVLKYNGSAWVSTVDAGATNLGALTDVNSAGAANGQVLIYNSTTSAWEPGNMTGGGGGGGSSTLVGLTDTPTNYAGAAGYFVKVNAGASAVEFVADPGYLSDLTSFTTTDLIEGTNQYFTNARADARIAAASINDLTDVDTSGVALNNALKWNGSAWVVGTISTDLSANTTTDLDEGTNLYYTEARANAAIDAKIAAKTTDDLSEGVTNLYYTTARANTNIDARLTSTGITGAKITNWDTAYGWGDHSTAGYLTDLTGSTLTSLSDVDAVAGAGDDGKILYYDHASTSFKWKTESGALVDTDGLPEGSSNLYYTDARADARIVAAGSANWNTAFGWGDHSTAGYQSASSLNSDIDSHLNQSNPTSGYVLSWNGSDYAWVAQSGGVTSVNGSTGAVTLDTDDVAEGSTNLYYTDTRFDARLQTRNISNLADVDTTGASNGQAFVWSSANSRWQPGTITGYSDSDVDTHLNQSNPTAGYVLSWNGSDYAWVAQSAGGGGTMSNLVEDTTPQLGGTLDANGNTIDMGTNSITDTKVGQWDTAYSWGDHSTAGYLTSFTETNDLSSAVTWANVPDANITSSSVVQHQANLTITESQISDLQSYLTAETSHADVVVDGDFTSQGIMLRGASAGSYSILTDNSANWNTAFGWGDHSTAGYLTSVPAQSFASLTGKPTTLAGYGITDGYTNSDVDAHLNQSNPTAGYVLSWNGSDYAWIDNTGYTSFNTDFDTRLGTKTTTDLTEGTNLYYTDTRVDSRITGNWLIDEDNMASDSATKIPSQQSVKAYVDSQVATANELGEMTDVTLTSVANNDFLKYNSSTSQWENATVTASTAAGSDTYVQFNDGGVMGGDAGFVYNKTTDELTVGSVTTTGASPSVSAAGNLTIETTASNGSITLTPNGTGNIALGANVVVDGTDNGYLKWTAPYATTGDLPSATTYHGMFAHVHGTGKGYFAHGGNWVELANHSQLANSSNWDTAYGWGDHSTAGYLTAETNDLSSAVTWANVPDANITQSSVTQHQSALTITESQISDLQSYLTAETSHADVVVDGDFTSQGIMLRGASAGQYSILTDNSANWNTAYSWGDHSTAGYLTSLTSSGLTTLSDVDAVTGAGDDGKVLYYDHASTSFKWKNAGGGTFGIAGNTGTHTFDTATETLTFLGTTGQINATVATNFISLELDSNINSITSIAFEGSTADANETKLQAIDPTADRTINLPDADGTVALTTDLYTDSDVDTHLNQSNPTSGFVLSWNGSDYAWVAQSGGSALTVQDEGSSLATAATTLNFVGAGVTASGTGATKTITIAGGGGSAGTEYEEFKINYATNGDISSISDTSSGVSSVSIDSATGGDLTVNFTGYTTPPLSMMMYGYVYSQNKYSMNTLGSTGTTLREIPGGGSSGSPTAFGSFSSLKIRVSESETGAARSFGTTTHAWVRFVMGA